MQEMWVMGLSSSKNKYVLMIREKRRERREEKRREEKRREEKRREEKRREEKRREEKRERKDNYILIKTKLKMGEGSEHLNLSQPTLMSII
ncbi:hypothetical protein DUI87_18612 [Hirundo rustica rustica]|uniref:IBB domain-containing protein n=1 Tax=Hirundo rustica rustica TaxID=333673 RepID=A0A3M0K2I1_HIRRU|nr:hypothetical protein DUI87_18612 [Hirundo rustica rustica]